MKKWFVFLVMVLAARLAAADEHVVYEYLSTCYKNTQGSWNAAYVQHEGRLFGNTPTLSISNDKKVVWVKAANFEGAFYYIETLPGGDRLYNYKEVGAPDPMFLALIYPEAAIDQIYDESTTLLLHVDGDWLRIIYHYNNYLRNDRYNFRRYTSAPINTKRKNYEEQQRKLAEEQQRSHAQAAASASQSRPAATPAPAPRAAAQTTPTSRVAQPTSAPYKVGDYYCENGKEGVVIQVSADGRHGKIVSLKKSWTPWCIDQTEANKVIGASSRTDGEANMRVIRQRPNWQNNYPAAAQCAQMGEGWYLPAVDELKHLFENQQLNLIQDVINPKLVEIGGEPIYSTWSSTESSHGGTWALVINWIYRSDAGYEALIKEFKQDVRPIAKF
ncbi:MAG: hypothetical protein IKM37_00965 [Alistipes sp.]|nr:hypothetical protein [Alistipes sp.]